MKKKKLKLTDSEIVDLGFESFCRYIETMSKERLLRLLHFIYGYALKK